jgi:inosine-uridine nucleoside N-ribohydrolase
MFRSSILLPVLFSIALPQLQAAPPEPVRLILDTDIGNDVDDALALAMIHALETRSEVQLLAVTITKDNRFAAPYVDLVNTFYGRAGIPIGVVRHGKAPEDASMLRVPAEKRDAQGAYLYPHRLTDGNQAAEAVQLLYRILREQPDQSVTIAQIGFSTNLARIIQSEDGKALVRRKVKLLSVMAGNFQKPVPEYNVATDAESAQHLFADWPTPIVFSGFEVGLLVTYPYESIEKDFSYAANHPVVDAYKLYVGKPHDHPNWDSTAVLYAIRADRDYFDLSAPGRVTLNAQNATVFTPDPSGNCRYLIVKPHSLERVREAISELVSQPPQPSLPSAGTQRMVF